MSGVREGQLLGGHYRIGKLIGQGAMGAVYEAVHERLSRPVAVKVLLARGGDFSQEQVVRFEREARAAAALGHPNIVQVTDFQWLRDEPPVLVMERIAGESLRAMIARQRALPPALVCFLGGQILDALSAAHRAGIVHRDIKPDNVCLVPLGSGTYMVKVVDFGIAKLVGESSVTSHGALLGTPAYMAPEQALGQPVDARTDVYAVGATLYHALSGTLPIDENTPLERILDHVVSVSARPLASFVPSVPAGLSQVIAQAMQKSIAGRFPSAEAFRAALAPFGQPAQGHASLGPSPVAPHASMLAQSLPGGAVPVYAASAHVHAPAASSGLTSTSAAGAQGSAVASPQAPSYGISQPGISQPGISQPGISQPTGTAPIPVQHAAPPPSKATNVLLVAGLALGGLALLVALGVGGYVVYAQSHAGTGEGGASTPSAKTPLAPTPASAEGPTFPSSSTPNVSPSVPESPGKNGRFVADAGVSSEKDAGAPLADAGAKATDAGAPANLVASTVARSNTDFEPYGYDAQPALAVFDRAVPDLRACLPVVCLRTDKIVQERPFLSVDVRFMADKDHKTKLVGFSELPSGPPCAALQACLAPRMRALAFPAPKGTGPFRAGLKFQ
jgi:serine/threonine protein kinase